MARFPGARQFSEEPQIWDNLNKLSLEFQRWQLERLLVDDHFRA